MKADDTPLFVTRIVKPAFSVIGFSGSTDDGDGFIAHLWEMANCRFGEISDLVCKEPDGSPAGVWGCMSDFSLAFQPWADDFSRGLYLAGAECPPDAKPPHGWTKWNIPGFVYLAVENTDDDAFSRMLAYLRIHNIPLAGAIQEYTHPASGKSYLYFPVERL
ncbi:MAG: GyrI-like domain-containing protein [Clostridia bacterium]|nr:GyrI-like domain-containing protein [Clostridia bacterium]